VRTHWFSAAGRVTGTRATATCGGGRRLPCRGHCHSRPTRHRRPAPQPTSQRPRIRRVHNWASCAATEHHRIATAQPRNWPLLFSPASTPLLFALTRPTHAQPGRLLPPPTTFPSRPRLRDGADSALRRVRDRTPAGARQPCQPPLFDASPSPLTPHLPVSDLSSP
jgi:hypothetical protein